MRRTAPALVPTALALALGLLVAAPASAQQFSTLEERMSAADFKRAGLDKLSEEELAQLNTWLQRDAATRAPAALAPAATGEDRAGFPSGGLLDARSGPDRIVSRVNGSFRGWRGEGDLISLENGQVWRVTDSSTDLQVDLQDPRVILERSGLGGWQLRVDGYNTRARVVRVR